MSPPTEAPWLGAPGRRLIFASLLIAASCADSPVEPLPRPVEKQVRLVETQSGFDTLPKNNDRRLFDRALAEHYDAVDPNVNGWTNEEHNDRIGALLQELGELWSQPQRDDDRLGSQTTLDALERLCSTKFETHGLIRPDAEIAYQNQRLKVRLGPRESGLSRDASLRKAGIEGLAQALVDLRAPYDTDAQLHFKFKLFDVQSEAHRVHAQALFQADGRAQQADNEQSVVQQNSTWKLELDISDAEAPLLHRIDVDDYVENRSGRGHFFEDYTESVFAQKDLYEGLITAHLETWMGSIQAVLYGGQLGHNGIAIGDADGDGLEDLYVCQAGGIKRRESPCSL